MEQVAWAALGILAAISVGNFWYLGNKFDSVNARFDSLSDSVNSRIDGLAARFDARFDALSAQLQVHIEEHQRAGRSNRD